jgi:hypothetical protein
MVVVGQRSRLLRRRIHPSDAPHSDRPGPARRKGKEKATDPVQEAEVRENASVTDTTERFSNQGLNLQVFRKVKGLWQIMNLPNEDYVFSYWFEVYRSIESRLNVEDR